MARRHRSNRYRAIVLLAAAAIAGAQTPEDHAAARNFCQFLQDGTPNLADAEAIITRAALNQDPLGEILIWKSVLEGPEYQALTLGTRASQSVLIATWFQPLSAPNRDPERTNFILVAEIAPPYPICVFRFRPSIELP